MEIITVRNVSFSYPLSSRKVLDDLSFAVKPGEFIVLCGESGCGKTTLLKHLKKELTPNGNMQGSILINGKNTKDISLRESAQTVGFVMQNPDNQLVTDKVWHELCFGLENLGLSTQEIRLRTAETAAYFGIGSLFEQSTGELSGGQKQLINLASVCAMHPQILLLDEPTSQLDPIAAEQFLFTLHKLNRELGITVILSEQRLEECLAYADRILIMEQGKILFDSSPKEAGKQLISLPAFFGYAAPTPMRCFSAGKGTGECPVTVREGRNWLMGIKREQECPHAPKEFSKENALQCKDVCFRYQKNGKDILKNCSLQVPMHSFFALLGENGAGKSTLLRLFSGELRPYSGSVQIGGQKLGKSRLKTALLPQQPESLFTRKSVYLDFKEVNGNEEAIQAYASLCKLTHLLDRHPFDLSGGELQRAAFCKLLLLKPDILLLDEPTKGMDAAWKREFANILKQVMKEGATVVMNSHDVEFCASHTDFCALLFDGGISATAPTPRFFSVNRFYTTFAARMAYGLIQGAVTQEDIIKCITRKP